MLIYNKLINNKYNQTKDILNKSIERLIRVTKKINIKLHVIINILLSHHSSTLLIIKNIKYINKNTNDDLKRKKTILKTLCLSIIFFLLLLLILSLYSLLTNTEGYTGVSITILLLFIIICFISLVLSFYGRIISGSVTVLLLIYSCIFYGSINWGADLPTVLIALFITVLISGILINSKVGLICALLLSTHLYVFNYVSNNNIININHTWKNETFNMLDVAEYSFLLIFAALFSWLSNSQLERALKKYKEIEIKLQSEKDNLETKVKERTEQIKKLQIDKINSMYRMVEFGRISSGLFHDIMSPLTNITLNLQMLKIDDVKDSIKNLTPSIKKIDNLIEQSKKHIRIDDTCVFFNTEEEIRSVISILKYKSNKKEVKLIFSKKSTNLNLHGSQTLFSHIIINLLSNGIDAHDKNSSTEADTKNKIVLVTTKLKIDKLHIKVTDNGDGINKEIIKEIFEPFYTTKKEHGCGIGLSSTKHILEKYFNGEISVKSKQNKGTSFTVSIPI